MIRLAHFADNHLAPSGGRIDEKSGLNARLIDRYNCTRFVVEDAISRGANLLLGAGDLFNSPKPSPTERRLAIEAFAMARDAGIETILLLGNHEMTRNLEEKHALDTLRDIEKLTIVDRPQMLYVGRAGNEQAPCFVFGAEELEHYQRFIVLTIACLPHPNRQLLLRDADTRALSPGELNQLIREKMMDIARGLAAQRVEGVPCVLLGHFAVDTAEAGKQNSLAMLGAEFTLNVYELQALGFQAVMLGHYHKPQMLTDFMWYSGSPEACSFGEEGEAKQYLLWDIEYEAGPNEPPTVTCESIPTPYRRLRTLSFPDDLHLFDNSPTQAFDIEGEIIRLKVRATDADQAASYTNLLTEAGAHEIRVEIERAEIQRRRESDIASATSLEQALNAWLEQKPELKEQREALLEEAQRVEEGINAGA